jgi:serpin B
MRLPRLHRVALALAVLIAGTTACPQPVPTPDARDAVGSFARSSLAFDEAPDVELADVRDLGDRQLALALELLAQADADENRALSPTSIAMAFAMLSAGARGDTLAELEAALHLPPQDDLHSRMNALLLALRDRDVAATDDSDGLVLAPVNDLYPQQGFAVEPAFLDVLGERYDAGVWLMDFVNRAAEARAAINAAIDEATRGKIPELLPEGSIDAGTRLVLTNALYLKGAWASPFDPASTRDETFRAPGGDVTVPFVHGVHDTAKHVTNRQVEVTELPLVGGQIALDLIPLSSFADGAPDAIVLAEALATLDESPATPVDIALPKFTTRVKTNLVPALQALGVDDLFGAADLSGISATADLTVTGAFHETFFALDEKGVEAAAATAIVVGETSIPPPPVTVVLDEPFLFILRDTTTNTPLFVGSIASPGVDG